MGRNKVSMVPIIDIKKRNIAFKQRKAGLIKKARELAILCDVNVSMIIFSDLQENNPEIFPSNDPNLLNDSINAYKSKRVGDPGKIKTYGLQDFYKDRKKKAEDDLAKAKKRNLEAKYPTRFGVLDNSSEVELRNFASELGTKTAQVKKRIDVLGKFPKTDTLDAQGSSCKQLSNPMTMMNPVSCNDCNFDHVGYRELSKPISMMDLPLKSEDENKYHSMELYGDNQNLLSMQSSNPNSIIRSKSDSSCYDSENFRHPPLPLAMVQPEELPLMHMNSFLASSSFPLHALEYETSGYKYLA